MTTRQYAEPVKGCPSRWSDDCPLCFHPAETHDGEACSVEEDYDHINGFHECGCPLTAPSLSSRGLS